MRLKRQATIRSAFREWWRDRRGHQSFRRTAGELIANLWEFARDSMPERRRRRFGDVEFDWENRVNTTSATVPWRERLIGVFSSGYQASEPALFHEMIGALPVDLSEFTFLDLGSGKGRALLMASDYPFRRILGVELLPQLHRAAQENLKVYKGAAQRCFALESLRADVRQFEFPDEPLVIYLFNPFLPSIFEQVIARLEGSLAEHPRPACILYHNPLLEEVVMRHGIFARLSRTHQYSVFANREAQKLAQYRL